MALKIEHIDNTSVRGVLDGDLDVTITRNDDGAIARIASWSREVADFSLRTVSDMRSLTYGVIASYREHQRGRLA